MHPPRPTSAPRAHRLGRGGPSTQPQDGAGVVDLVNPGNRASASHDGTAVTITGANAVTRSGHAEPTTFSVPEPERLWHREGGAYRTDSSRPGSDDLRSDHPQAPLEGGELIDQRIDCVFYRPGSPVCESMSRPSPSWVPRQMDSTRPTTWPSSSTSRWATASRLPIVLLVGCVGSGNVACLRVVAEHGPAAVHRHDGAGEEARVGGKEMLVPPCPASAART